MKVILTMPNSRMLQGLLCKRGHPAPSFPGCMLKSHVKGDDVHKNLLIKFFVFKNTSMRHSLRPLCSHDISVIDSITKHLSLSTYKGCGQVPGIEFVLKNDSQKLLPKCDSS